MPVVYQASCASCAYLSSVFPAEYAAVWLERAPQGPQALLGAMVSTSDSPVEVGVCVEPNLVILAHPLESSILASIGHTWRRLLREGRYVAMSTVLCAGCGRLHMHRRLATPGPLAASGE